MCAFFPDQIARVAVEGESERVAVNAFHTCALVDRNATRGRAGPRHHSADPDPACHKRTGVAFAGAGFTLPLLAGFVPDTEQARRKGKKRQKC